MNYLVTGGAGFIGSHLVERLLHAGHQVTVFDNFQSGSLENLQAVRDDPKLSLVEGDIRDFEATCRVTEGRDAVFHLAALVSVPTSIESPQLSFDINATGSHHVLEAARLAGAKRVVLASSSAVYGDNPDLPLCESAQPSPLSPYGSHKLLMEQMGATHHAIYGVDVTALRFFNVYGQRQDASSPYSGVISIFLRRLLNNEPLIIYGDGEQTRDFIYVEDVVKVLERSMELPGCEYRVYNVASGLQTRIAKLAELLIQLTGITVPIVCAPARHGDILRSQANVDAITSALHLPPPCSLREGLSLLVRTEGQTASEVAAARLR